MKILLATIIFIFSLFVSILLIQQYRAPSQSKTTSSIAETATKVASTSIGVSTSTATTIPAPNAATIQSTSLTVIHATTKKQNNNKVAGVDVNKLVSVTSSQGLKPKALKSALNAYAWALNHGKLGVNKDTLTVVDFTLPSYEKRMWVLSLHQNKVLMKLYTTQGAGSGLVYANRFSNTSMTQASSLGLYVTSDEYSGKHGKSMRLDGLQKGINSNARKRNIVIHEAPYASPAYIKAYHRAGRSWGCFAVAPSSKKVLLNYVRGGSALFVYARAIEKTPIVSHGVISI